MIDKEKLVLMSWNVNGIRAILKKNFLEFLYNSQPDIICLQETKATPEQVHLNLEGYRQYWNSAIKKGYSGTAIFSKLEPLNVVKGIGIEEHDQEGRVITLEFSQFFLVNVYTPNSQHELKRLDYRIKKWEKSFGHYLKDLERQKPVIFCGDLNVAHQEIDIARPKANTKNPGFTAEERQCFDTLLKSGFVDTFRMFHQEPHHYTWWSYRAGAREKNIGWRIDYFCVSKDLEPYLVKAEIFPQVLGSDHCPISLTMQKPPLLLEQHTSINAK